MIQTRRLSGAYWVRQMGSVRRAARRATLVDVARAAGVSVSTASVVLNSKKTIIPVSEATRARTLAAAEALRYEPNVLARAFVQQRSNMIGVSIGDPSGYVDAEKVRGVKAFFEQKGYTLLISTNGAHDDIAGMHMKAFMSRRIEGLIVMDAYKHIPESCLLELAREHVPVVLVERDIDDPRIPAVHVADREGTRMAVAHLVEHGREHIAFISGPVHAKPIAESLLAYRSAIESAGIGFDERYVAPGDWLSSGGYFGMEELFRRNLPINAVCAANDSTALGAMRAIRDRGLGVPEDIAVMGFDDIPVLAPYAEPALSTVGNPLFLVGRTAAAMLHHLISGRECPKTVVLPVDLVVRESCGCTSQNNRGDSVRVADWNQARELGERTWMRVEDQVVSVVWGHAFCVQDRQRKSGLRVRFQPAMSSLSLSPGDVVSVSGCLTTVRGVSIVRDPYIEVTGRTAPPDPVEAQVSELCQQDASEERLGVFVETTGCVVFVYPDTMPETARIAAPDGAEIDVLPMETDYSPRVGEGIRVSGILDIGPDGRVAVFAVRVRPGHSSG